jgi:hypothetical protein
VVITFWMLERSVMEDFAAPELASSNLVAEVVEPQEENVTNQKFAQGQEPTVLKIKSFRSVPFAGQVLGLVINLNIVMEEHLGAQLIRLLQTGHFAEEEASNFLASNPLTATD